MCSFLVYKGGRHRFTDDINRLLKPRGPDLTNIIEVNGFTFVHNLLSITGEVTPQPFVDGDIVCVYNGQIYNFLDYGNYKNDGECLIPLYKEYGTEFTKKLDGEFSICLFDFSKGIIVVSKDIFGTKPLYIAPGFENFACASYQDPLRKLGFAPAMPEPNQTYVFSQDWIKSFSIKEWNLDQYVDSFEPWNEAFSQSIKKRTRTDKSIFMGLSSGHDSGAILCECLKQGVNVATYSVLGNENMQVIYDRVARTKNPRLVWKDVQTEENSKKWLMENTDEYHYDICSEQGDYFERKPLYEDSGGIWLNFICELAKKDKKKVLLSGAGADEIVSDYGYNGERIFPHSNFGGLFPDDLTKIFPWRSFYFSTMRDYLAKDEYVTGAHGIEGRYPFLDSAVVQAFLNLTAKLKNSRYKSVISKYLESNQFPFEDNMKRGF